VSPLDTDGADEHAADAAAFRGAADHALGEKENTTMKDSRLGLGMIVLCAVGCTACASRVGPVVTDVRYAPDGRLLVERCDLVLTYVPFQYVPDPSFENCTARSPRSPQ
jgi:hypothetical protein